jgi:hypothetical protein
VNLAVAGGQRRHADGEDVVTTVKEREETAAVVIVQRNIQRRCGDDGSQRPC